MTLSGGTPLSLNAINLALVLQRHKRLHQERQGWVTAALVALIVCSFGLGLWIGGLR